MSTGTPPATNPKGSPVSGATSYVPTRKVGAGAFAGAVSVVVVWCLNSFVLGSTKITPEIASAITTILTFVVGYFIPEPGQ
jgi:H+/Cl- antiporter ClcA